MQEGVIDLEFKVLHADKPLKKQVVFHERVKLTLVGQFAKDLAQMIAMSQVANQAQGRSAVHLSNEEIVDKACNLAELFYESAADRGMLIDVPSLDELMVDDSSPPGFRAVGGR